jgi:site-specific DNA-methyltransferase (cytosine-N4-specific)
MKKKLPSKYKLNGGFFYNDDSLKVLKSKGFVKKYQNKIDLVFTSPPFPLITPKKYNNKKGEDYVNWFAEYAKPLKKVLSKKGSIVIEIGNSWTPGYPTHALIEVKALMRFMEKGGFHLCQEFVWYNPAKLPGPAEWVTKYRERVKDSFTKIWWFAKTPRPHADNREILTEYSKGMLKLLEKKKYNSGKRATGHNISTKGFFTRNKGAIPPNVFKEFDNFLEFSNTNNVNKYREYCLKKNLPAHPARMPHELAEFFIRFLTKKKSLVLDPFAGSNTTGYVASKLGRKWLSIEKDLNYIKGSNGWFK